MWKITIEELPEKPVESGYVPRYEQVVREIDLDAVMAAVNKRPRKQRAKKEGQK